MSSGGPDAVRLEPAQLEEFAVVVADLHTTLYDVPPSDVSAELEGNRLICRLQGGLTMGDLMMLQHGHADELRNYRAAFFAAVAAQFEIAVAALTRHSVVSQSASFDPAGVITVLEFELSPNAQDAAEQRQALRNWSEQVRRSSRRLRSVHISARETQRELAEQLRETREQTAIADPPA